MTITAKVTAEDVRKTLNGVESGSGYFTFWDQTISSGSVFQQINMSNDYLYGTLGLTKMDSTDEVISNHIKTAELDYACMRVLVLLSGGVVTEGFSWAAGISVQQPQMLSTYKNLIEEFKFLAQNHLRAVQEIAVTAEADQPSYGKTSPSVM